MKTCISYLVDVLKTCVEYLALVAVVMSTAGCSGMESPKKGKCFKVGSEVEIKWTPDKEPMVIQYYQNEQCLLNCESNPPHEWSGSRIKINTTGKTEIKIWKPGDAKPFDNVWIFVEEKCPNIQ